MEGLKIKPNLTNLREARKAKGYSQQYMADKMGISQMAYHYKEKGKSPFTLQEARIAAAIFNTDIETLFYSTVFRFVKGGGKR